MNHSGTLTCRRSADGLFSRGIAMLATVLLASSSFGTEGAKRLFNIEAGKALDRLPQFAQQARVELVFAIDKVEGVRTNPVKGEFTAREALERMLARTPLVPIHDEQTGAFAVRRSSPPRPSRAEKDGVRRTLQPPPADDSAVKAAGEAPLIDEPVLLTPFEVRTSADVGYVATETLVGSRLATPLSDVASRVTVMTPEFLQDLAITSLDEAMQYSLNTESRFETGDVSGPGGFGIADTTVPGLGSTRMRSLGTPNTGHDFFDTGVPIDSYNTERFTFSSGPNSILFDNSQPSGTIDTNFKRAALNLPRHEISSRIDNRDSHRISADLNQPLVRSRLAVRLGVLSERKHDWREPAFANQDRIFASLVFRIHDNVSFRAWYECASLFSNAARNTLVQDHVTRWRNAGSPAFDNGGGLSAPFPPVTSPFARHGASAPVYAFNSSGVVGPVGTRGNTVTSLGFDSTTAPPDNFERSVVDSRLYPFDRSFSGNANQSKMNAWIGGAIIEANPLPDFFLEAGFNREQVKHKGSDFFDNLVGELNVDANRFLDDRVTANPNLGRYYFENTSPLTRRNYSWKEQRRLSLSYQLDFQQRRNSTQWLGRHRLALMLDRRESATIWEESEFRVVGDHAFTSDNPNSRSITFRYYLDPAHPTIKLPFDTLAEGLVSLAGAVDANGKPVTIAAWDPSVVPNTVVSTRTLVDSRTFVVQSCFEGNRLVIVYGQRRDVVEIQQALGLSPRWDFEPMARSRLPWITQKVDTPVTSLKSIVAHPWTWLAIGYVESDSEHVSGSSRRNLDGTLAVAGAGRGHEFSATVRWGDRLSLQFTRFENSAIGNLSSVRSPTPTPTIGGNRGSNLRREVANLERSAQIYESIIAGDPTGKTFVRSASYAAYQNAVAQTIPTGQNAGSALQNTFDLLSDRVSRGTEITLVGNPTPNWRLSISATRSETSESNIGPQYFDFIRERLPVWAQYADRPFLPNTQGATIGQVLDVAVLGFNYARLSEDRANTLERRYRFTGTMRYSASRGPMKGSFIGANTLWRSPAAVGYYQETISDNPFVVPGRTTNIIEVDDLDRPIRGGGFTSFDLFFGHQRRLFAGRVAWRVQVNIRNLFDRNALLPQRALSSGAGAIYTVQEPRSVILTNTFGF